MNNENIGTDTNVSTENKPEEIVQKPKKEKKDKKSLSTEELVKKLRKKLRVQSVSIAVLYVLVVFLGCMAFLDTIKFGCAELLINSGNIETGVKILNTIPDYDGAEELLSKYKYTVKGNIVKLGTYEQDLDNSNGKEAIEWVVLDYDEKENKSLLLCLNAIECKPYKDGYGAASWENSDVRAWLNNNFIRSAFTGSELGIILDSEIETPDNIRYSTSGGNITADKVFLLSDAEFMKYLSGTEYAIGYSTPYSRDRGVQSGPISGTSVCWLRTPGESLVYVSTVSYVGELNSMGVYTYSASCGVRPAIWVDAGAK